MRDTYDKPMKILYTILILLLSITATSCEEFGVEVTTVKGIWKSDTQNAHYIMLYIFDDRMSYGTFYNDSILSTTATTGTWSLHNDTLSLYHQDINADGVRTFKIDQMSMNTMTLRNVSNKDVWIMTRQYSTPNNDYDSHFNEVFDLKKGFWWFFWNGLLLATGLFCCCYVGILLRELLKVIDKFIRYIVQKTRK